MAGSALGSRVGSWLGSVGGASVGALTGGVPGGLVGLGAGLLVDRQRLLAPFSPRRWRRGGRGAADALFAATLFGWAGHVAKADGRVSEAEIGATRALMTEMRLKERERRLAIELFTRGKQPGFPARTLAQRFRRRHDGGGEAARRLFRCLCRIVLANAGEPAPAQRRLLRELAKSLRLAASELEYLERRRRSTAGGSTLRPTLRSAFQILQLPEHATEDEIRLAYRRMISRHHPDRLVARGVPDEEVREAAARTREIRAAYEEIRRLRGF